MKYILYSQNFHDKSSAVFEFESLLFNLYVYKWKFMINILLIIITEVIIAGTQDVISIQQCNGSSTVFVNRILQ